MIFLSAVGESFFQLIFALLVFVGVLAITAFVTKWIAGYQKTMGATKNLEIIEAIRLANNKYVQIIRAGEENYYVVAIGKDEVTFLGQIDSSQLKEIEKTDTVAPTVDFKSILNKLTKN